MASTSAGQHAAHGSRSKLGLLDLPLENQTEILEYISTKTLFSLQVVSKHFHKLASSRIYRSLVFVLSHPDAPQYYRESRYRLADALQVFAASDYDYAQHVKKFQLRMSENESDDAQRRIASRYHASEEPTMFLNMALLLMIKKARAMEIFSWDVPVELSPNVYDALSKIQSLQCLHVRLDIASITRTITMPHPSIPIGPEFTQQIANSQYFPPIPTNTGPYPPSGSAKNVTAINKSKLMRMRVERRRFGNFNDLRALHITAIDSLDCLDQIRLCLAQSSKTVRLLSLSLSHALVKKARKMPSNSQPGPPAVDPMDDDEGVTEPTTPETNIQAPAAPNDADIKKERKEQESTLARVFGFEKPAVEDMKLDKSLKAAAKSVKLTPTESGQIEKLKRQLSLIMKSPVLNELDACDAQEIVKTLRERLDKVTLLKASKTASKPKPAKKVVTKKPKPTGTAWMSTPPYPLPPEIAHWDPLPPLPQAGSSSDPLAKPNTFLPYTSSVNKNGPAVSDADLFSSLFGGPGGNAMADIGFLPSSSSQASNVNYNSTNAPKPSSGFSFGMPKTSHSSQPPQFGNNAFPSSYSGSVSHSPYDAYYSLTPQALIQKLMENNHKKYQHASLAAIYQKYANQAHQNNGKPTSQTSTTEDLVGVEYVPSDTSSSLDELDKPSDVTEPNLPEQTNGIQTHESGPDMDIDMEHPDVVGESDGNDAGSEASGMSQDEGDEGIDISNTNGVALPNSVDSLQKENVPLPTEVTSTNDMLMNSKETTTTNAFDGAGEETKPSIFGERLSDARLPEDIMQEYIRMTHGFSIEELSLYLVPLKPSVLAKALNLSCLRRVEFYSVGPQGAFWTMLEKFIEQGSESALRIIHTDDVSTAFVRCVSKLNGLQQLHLMRRSTKDFDSTTSKAPATIDEIRKLALLKHLATLESLSIVNNEDDKWDLSGKCIRLLAARGKKLRELACSMDTTHFHLFVQCLPGIRNLEAVNFITIRSTERMATLNRECRKFIVDVLHYYPELKLKYMAMSNLVYQFSSKPKISLPEWLSKQEQTLASRAGKGKGKAVELYPPASSGMPLEAESEELSDLEEARPNIYVAKHWRINEVPEHYFIFSNEVRKGRF